MEKNKIIVTNLSNSPLRASYRSIIHNKDIVLVHEAKAIPHIHRIIKEFNPELMIEFGTSWGGITLVLHECNTKIELHSYDIKCNRKPDKSLFNNNVQFHLEDILSIPKNSIINLCKDGRKKILYCDNGNKIKEIELYAKYLNIGDMLGVHDWGKEIEYKDIDHILCDFIPIEHDLFEKNKWTTRFWKKMH